jgi:hypothetical protein
MSILSGGAFSGCKDEGSSDDLDDLFEEIPQEESGGADLGTSAFSVMPGMASVVKGGRQKFAAYLKGKETAFVTWNIFGNRDGDTKVEDGLLTVASGETAETLMVTANPRDSASKTFSVSVTVLGNGRGPEGHGITVSPGAVIVDKGSSQTFTATLSADGKAAVGVKWTVSVITASSSAIDAASGVLSVNAEEAARKLIVRAELGSKYGTAIVYVDNAPPGTGPFPVNLGIVLNPQLVTLERGMEKAFSADGVDKVKWSIYGKHKSRISESGVLSVAADETAEKIVVRAEDAVNSGKHGTAVVTVRGNEKLPAGGPVSDGLMIEPAYTSVAEGGAKTFRAKDYYGNEVRAGLVWRVTGGGRAGTALDGGLLTVAVDETAAYLTVRAERSDGSNGTAIAEVIAGEAADDDGVPKSGGGSKPEDHGLKVTPGRIIIGKGFKQTFTATVSGSDKAASGVTWTVSAPDAAGGVSSISTGGVLTVDPGETAKELVVRAELSNDRTKYGTAVVYVYGNGGGSGTGGGPDGGTPRSSAPLTRATTTRIPDSVVLASALSAVSFIIGGNAEKRGLT